MGPRTRAARRQNYAERKARTLQEAQIAQVPHLRRVDSGAEGMEHRRRRATPLLGEASLGDAAEGARPMRASHPGAPDLGDLVIVLLASTLAGLRDRLAHDGFDPAAELVGDLVEIADDYLTAVTD